jgi:hypothetical protein
MKLAKNKAETVLTLNPKPPLTTVLMKSHNQYRLLTCYSCTWTHCMPVRRSWLCIVPRYQCVEAASSSVASEPFLQGLHCHPLWPAYNFFAYAEFISKGNSILQVYHRNKDLSFYSFIWQQIIQIIFYVIWI